MANKVSRRRDAVKRFLDAPQCYREASISSRPRIVYEKAERRLGRAAGNGEKTAKEICNELNLDISVSKTRQCLSSNVNLRIKKVKSAQTLIEAHKGGRMD